MSTVDKEAAENIKENNGYFDGDDDNSMGDNPRVVKIVHYVNQWGGNSYGLIFEGQDPNKYQASEFVNRPQTYWEYHVSNPS